MILKRAFYEQETLTVARQLLGKVLVHESPEGTAAGRIVETEAYMGPEDRGSHSFGGLRTARTEPQFGPKGHSYIYFIYGLYYCFNVTSGAVPGKPEAVLVRALEPISGIDLMLQRRAAAKGNLRNLANGPSRLCMAMELTRKQNGADLCVPPFHIDVGEIVREEKIVATTRIGIDYAGEWKNKPWRFYIKDNVFVSVRAKKQAV